MMRVSFWKTLGNFNWANPSEKSWQVAIQVHGVGKDGDNIGVDAIWDKEDEPYVEDMIPSQVIDLIEERIKSYWIYTGREKDLAKIAVLREHSDEIFISWAKGKIASYRDCRRRDLRMMKSLQADIDDLIWTRENSPNRTNDPKGGE